MRKMLVYLVCGEGDNSLSVGVCISARNIGKIFSLRDLCITSSFYVILDYFYSVIVFYLLPLSRFWVFLGNSVSGYLCCCLLVYGLLAKIFEGCLFKSRDVLRNF